MSDEYSYEPFSGSTAFNNTYTWADIGYGNDNSVVDIDYLTSDDNQSWLDGFMSDFNLGEYDSTYEAGGDSDWMSSLGGVISKGVGAAGSALGSLTSGMSAKDLIGMGLLGYSSYKEGKTADEAQAASERLANEQALAKERIQFDKDRLAGKYFNLSGGGTGRLAKGQ